jgi:NAD(P)-dependent dehydrogenase (short-subunit alcohol dehydrogenase family)
VVADIDGAAAEVVAKEIQSRGGEAAAVRTDISSKREAVAAVRAGVERFAKLDILVNCAAIMTTAPFREMSEAMWDQTLAVNLKGYFLMSQAVLDSMAGLGWGRIVNVASRVIFRGRPNMIAYVASKGGVMAMSKSMAVELAPLGITVNVVAPGITLTGMTGEVSTELQAASALTEGQVAMPMRYNLPEEMAEAVLYFCGPRSDHTTGMTIHVNAGSFMP